MRKLFLLTLTCILSASLAWAADVSVVETYGTNLVAGSSTTRTSFQGRYTEWWYRNARSGATDQLKDGTNGFWLSRTSGSSCYLESTLEGGIKNVAFNWRQFGTGDNGYSFVLNINTKIGSAASVTQKSITWTGANSYVNNDQSYSQAVAIKANDVKLTIQNVSTTDGTTAGGRILVGPITITPYLLYTQKDANVLLSQTGYIHEIIDNTDNEGSVSYESGNTSVAEVNATTGEITPRAAGDAVITATWSEGVTTTYTVHVIKGVVETFSEVNQTKVNTTVANWSAADLCNWEIHYARRGSNDQMNGKQYSWLTLADGVRGYIKTTNLEGGIKDVSFHYGQFGAEAETLLRWQVSAIGTATTSDVIERDGDLGENRSYSRGAYYTRAFNCAENAQLEIKNMSVKDDESQPTSNARLMVSDIYITPYLLYTTKAATLDTRNGLSLTNNGLINNTSGDAVTYSIEPIDPTTSGASIDAATGEVTAANDEAEGNFTVTATWGEVTTTYTLTVVSRTATTASYENAKVTLNLGADVPANTLTKTAGYDGTIGYVSSNTAVATVTSEGVVSLAGGVGQATITATLPQTENYKAAEAKFDIFVEDPSALTETFNAVPKKNAAGHHNTVWDGDLFDWRVLNAVRKNGDVFPSDGERTGIWMAIPNPDVDLYGIIQSEGAVEGGIKYLSFYWEQWGSEAEHILKPAIYSKSGEDPEELKGSMEYMPSGAPIAANRMLFGANDVMRSNSQLILKNESHKSDNSRVAGKGRFIIDEIHITPYLLYTDKAHELYAGESYTNTALINNTGGNDITYSLEDNAEEAEIIDASTGEVRALKAGEVTVKATWNEGGAFTTYTLTILSKVVTEASYPNAIVRIGLNESVDNTLSYTAGYDGTIAYASSNTAVASVASNGAITINGVGQTTITATLPETENYFAAEASYNLYVRDNGARIETFSKVSQPGVPTDTEIHDWTGDLYDWQIQYQVRRGNNDKISAGTEEHQGTSIGIQDPAGTPLSSILQTKGDVEGGIKYLSFYWAQFGSGQQGATRRLAVYAGNDLIGYDEIPAGNTAGTESFLGINNAMKANKQLIIKNESYNGSLGTLSSATNNSRNILDNIYITPYLLYTTKNAELDLRIATTYTNSDLINNTESGNIVYSLDDNEGEASIDAGSGEVTGIKAGQVTVKATWSEGAFTTYTLNIISITETEASYPNAEIHATMGEAIPANVLNVTDGYDGTISYASSVPAVADFENGVLTLKAPGQTKITATLPETSNYTAATASYMLTVSYSNYESFNPHGTTSTYAKPEENAQGDICIWYVYIGGIQTPNYFSSNAITTRAQRTNESKQGYAKSAKLSGGISALAFNYSMMFADNNIEKWDIHVYVNDRLVGQLTNEAGGDLDGINGRTLNPMRTKVITGIDEPGMFVIRFENHSTIKEGVTYTEGNMGRFAIDNVSWENFDGAIELSESVDNSAVLAVNSGSTQDVTITRSTLVGGVWNTLCLPFAISKSSDLDDAEVVEMTKVEQNGDEIDITFSAISGDELAGGMPYLVRPASNKNISGTYSGKQIVSVLSSVNEDMVSFRGLYGPLAVTKDDYNTLFVGTPDGGNNLFYPQADGQLRGLRAYFKLITPTPMTAPLRRARYVINQKDVTTGMESVQNAEIRIQKVIRDGQMMIIREGKMYNAQGQVIK